ncbi:MAG: sulfurtransferase-like selenium metabolism protein YedF [Syntrophales bacterium]|nr:sulfurtransferase-like selenium metabolism protein YedF [Syntrophales bacterium]
MAVMVDARGQACPRPVLLAKQALGENEEATVLVDNMTAVENIRRMALRWACGFTVLERADGWEIHLCRTGPLREETETREGETADRCTASAGEPTGSFIVVLSGDRMGSGDDTLGEVLMRAFVATIAQWNPLPAKVICYNAGVKLTLEGAPTLEDLRQMETAGVEILICGTCANYYGITEQIRVGHLSHMYDIVTCLIGAGRVLRP